MKSSSSEILRTMLLVGTLDILAAMLYFIMKTGNEDVALVLKYIASGLFGPVVFSGSHLWALAGLALHYCVALTFVCLFYWALSRANVVRKNAIISGVAYAIFIWMTMNLIVVPLSAIGSNPLDAENAAINLLILVTCFGIPLSITANRHYKEKRTDKKRPE